MTKAARPLVLFATIVAFLAMAAAAQAQTVTVGADLTAPELFPGGCGEPGCASFLTKAQSPATATIAPFNGTVTAWRIEGALKEDGYGAEVFRKNGDGTYTVTAASPPVTPATRGIETFHVSLPIKAGEYVGTVEPFEAEIGLLEGESVEAFYEPAIGLGETEAPEGEFEQEFVIGFNADIEATPTPTLPVTPVAPPLVVTAPVPTCTVPQLSGKRLKAAKKRISKASCKVGKVTEKPGVTGKTGKVVKQKPKPGTVVAAGSKVSVKLG